MKKVTQEDIAKKLRITRTTVARALNNKGYVEAGLKEQILRTAEELGYRTNVMARSLAKKNGWRIYCFVVSYNDQFALELEAGLRAAEAEFQHYGIELHVLQHHPDSPQQQAADLEAVLTRGNVDGLIIAPMVSEEVTRILENFAPPEIAVSSINLVYHNRRSLFYVGSNPFECGALAAELMMHLIGGRGKIAVINAFNQFEALYRRFRGFITEIEKNKAVQIVENRYLQRIEESYDAASAILRECEDLDGLYTNTEVTYLARALRDSGRSDVKIVGNDLNDEIKEHVREGRIAMTLHDRPYLQGYLSGKYMCIYLLSRKTPRREHTYVGFDIAMRNNIDTDETFRILTNT
jgi:LacI family transcriptional regulator